MKKKKKQVAGLCLIVLTVCVPLFFPASPVLGGDSVQSRIVLTTDPASGKYQNLFSGYDKIYALVTLSGLDPGEYRADINWVDPAGNVSQYTPLSFTVQPQSPYTFYSWFRLMKNGPLKSGFTGKPFDDKYLGSWELHIFINDTMLEKATFEIR